MLLRRLARPMLAAIFIQGGIAALRDPKGHAEIAAPVLDRAAPVLDRVTETTPLDRAPSNLTLVQIDAGVKIGAGVLLALGRVPRLSAAALAASLIPTTLAGHRFWELDDPTEYTLNQLQFMKNLGLLGGLMLASADTRGKPSLAWWARRAGGTGVATAGLVRRDISAGVGQLADRAGQVTGEFAEAAGRAGGRAGGQAAEVAGRVGAQTARLAPVAARAGDRLTEQTERLRSEADTLSSRALKRAEKARKKARKRAEKARNEARKRTAKKLDQVSKRASKQLDRVSKHASQRAEVVSRQASKETSRRIGRANARAQRARATVESKLP